MTSCFPAPESADADGVIGYTRELDCRMLSDAYWHGIFPWPCEAATVLWCSPDPRGVLPLAEFHRPRRLERFLRHASFEFRVDTAFDAVIAACAAASRPGQDGTWITPKLVQAYREFHRQGVAHSLEAFSPGGELVGGWYGISLGRLFCGESMFFRESGASKFAFVHGVELLRARGVKLLDTQMVTPLTAQFGAREISRADYLAQLRLLRGAPLRLTM